MATFNIVCGGPGPHVPASGILGTSDQQPTADVRCSATVCIKPVDITVTNRVSLTDKATQAIAANIAFIGLTSPTNAQVIAQAKAQAKQWNALAKIVLDQLDDTTGT